MTFKQHSFNKIKKQFQIFNLIMLSAITFSQSAKAISAMPTSDMPYGPSSSSYQETAMDYKLMCDSYFSKASEATEGSSIVFKKCNDTDFATCAYEKVMDNNGMVNDKLKIEILISCDH